MLYNKFLIHFVFVSIRNQERTYRILSINFLSCLPVHEDKFYDA